MMDMDEFRLEGNLREPIVLRGLSKMVPSQKGKLFATIATTAGA